MTSTALTPGVHFIDAHSYHADPCEKPSLTASIAKTICKKSPLHAWAEHPRLNPGHVPVESETFDIGTAAHAVLLEGIHAVEVIDADSWRTNAAREQRDAARAAGRIPLLAAHWQSVQAMVEAAQIQLDGSHADPTPFTDGQSEKTIVWEEDGVLCRCRPDWLRDDLTAVDDYKTAATANPDRWIRGPLFDNGYDIQAAFYLRGIEKTTGHRPDWRFVVQEKTPPYALVVVALTPAVIELANDKVNYAIARWRECLQQGAWPGYPTEVCWAELPAWEETRWLEKEARES